MLRDADEAYLRRLGLAYQVLPESGLICVVIKDWPLPPGYSPERVDLLVRLPPGFPDAQPDMYWCDPPVRLIKTGGHPIAADQFEQYLGRTWQRFSRHMPAGTWRPGTDSLETYITLIRTDLARAA